jgi:glyoxylase-like metal-dependent hydrolase (beta-lactamase superfamily II)
VVVNCHLHFDHCGGNPALSGLPILVQTAERANAHGLEQIRGDIAAFEAAGVDELFFDLNFDSERVGSRTSIHA